jgi:hypothetical protein
MDKKIQGTLKSLVKAFGDLIHAWNDERNACFQHLNYIKNLIQTKYSIFQTLSENSKWSKLLVNSNHHDLHHRLITKLLTEMESTLTSIRESLRDLESLSIAMKLKGEEAWHAVTEVQLDGFGDACIFDSSHALEIVDLANDFFNESERIRLLCSPLISASFELSMTAIAVDTLFDEIRNVSESETKHGGSEKSFRLRVESFLLQNGLDAAAR